MSWQRRARARRYTDVQLVKEAGRASQGCAPPPRFGEAVKKERERRGERSKQGNQNCFIFTVYT